MDIPDKITANALGPGYNKTPWAISKTLPAAFDESLSYLEMLLSLVSKQNEVIEKLNSAIDVLNYHDNEITVLQNDVVKLRQDLEDAIKTINARIDTEVKTLNTRIDTEVETLNSRIDKEVEDLLAKLTSEVLKLNQRIDQEVDKLNTTIKNNYNELNTKIDDSVTTLNAKDNELDNKIDSNYNTLDSKIDEEINKLRSEMDACCNEVKQLIADKYNELVSKIDTADGKLQYNINQLYNMLIRGAITAQEYDDLEITATNYDDGTANVINGQVLQASDYDTNGKYYLMGVTYVAQSVSGYSISMNEAANDIFPQSSYVLDYNLKNIFPNYTGEDKYTISLSNYYNCEPMETSLQCLFTLPVSWDFANDIEIQRYFCDAWGKNNSGEHQIYGYPINVYENNDIKGTTLPFLIIKNLRLSSQSSLENASFTFKSNYLQTVNVPTKLFFNENSTKINYILNLAYQYHIIEKSADLYKSITDEKALRMNDWLTLVLMNYKTSVMPSLNNIIIQYRDPIRGGVTNKVYEYYDNSNNPSMYLTPTFIDNESYIKFYPHTKSTDDTEMSFVINETDPDPIYNNFIGLNFTDGFPARKDSANGKFWSY